MVSSVEPSNPLCDSKLLEQIVAVRRPAGSISGNSRRGPKARPAT